ncbi:hypothetical protein L915_20196 [Plasmopara halstedii]|uniref:Peptidase M14 domain-containing protein n=1 Tax=Plasmopara halstedii TaxID=4781 RepID=A0A0P1AFD3_PLAHL|nr:hypothetical protein L915_20196 [Plasmopara halstedii]CEG39105.1 hypothetical protein L915_20196 [Plasmopara halstedii]|eukprot:XP_024575474.1 hypothetical protein L915_20196 [Plasmopara halstedii]
MQYLPLLFLLGVTTINHFSKVTGYKERSYDEIVDYLLKLETMYEDYADAFSVQDRYNLPRYDEVNCTRNNQMVPCEQYVIKITEKATLPDPERPELIFSGCVHGNERVGPQVVVELAALLLSHASRSDGNPWLQHLVKTRTIVIVPTANANGYNHNARRELDVDPNRDFPYNLEDNTKCMVTTAARALNELWRDHLFQLGITFHAGRECITYEWGAKNHILQSNVSEKSPDSQSQQQLSRIMSRYGGKFEESGQFYQDGTMNDVVYPVDGGMEDWGYAASWENEFSTPKPIHTCNPSSFGGYPAAKTRYNNATHRAFNVLIETSENKQPNASSLGDSSTLSELALNDYLPATERVGHIPRNVRLSLLYIDLVQPYVLWKTHPLKATVAQAVKFKWEVAGAITVDSTRLKVWSDDPADAKLSRAQRGVTRWYHEDLNLKVKANNKGLFAAHLDFAAAGTYYVKAIATVDQSWATQGTGEDQPVPMVGPQTHIVNARTNDDWLYINNGRIVRGRTVWSSQVVTIVVT